MKPVPLSAFVLPPIAASFCIVAMLFAMLSPGLVSAGCTSVKSPEAQLAICVLNTYGADVAQGMTPEAAIIDAGVQCAIDAATAGNIVGASNAMHARISIAPKTDGGGK